LGIVGLLSYYRGSWVVRHLVDTYPEAYRIISFDKLDYCSSLNNARLLEKRTNFKFIHGDVTSVRDVMQCLQTYQVKISARAISYRYLIPFNRSTSSSI